MKHLSKGLAAGAAGLLLSAGLAAPASAAETDCVISVSDVAVVEGDEGTTALTFGLTATANTNGNPCNNIDVSYVIEGVTATEGVDFTATDGAVQFAGAETRNVTVTVNGDAVAEFDETLTITLSETEANASFAGGDNVATGTITDDDPGIAEGGAMTRSPASGPAGTVITVSGTGCTADTVDVFLSTSQNTTSDIVASSEDVDVEDDGDWTTTLTVPADADPALEHDIDADCGADFYATQDFDVTASSTGGDTGGGTGGDGTDVGNGYRMVAADGGIFTFGDRQFHGSTGDIRLNQPIVGGATDISDYEGYWIVARDGGVFAFNAEFHGSLAGQTLSAAVAEIEPTPTGKGYWIVLADGKVYTFGDANHFGDMSGRGLNKPVVGVSVTPTGKGYWLVAEDGGIFNFGDADFFGSMGATRLNAPVIDLAPAVDNNGYYLLGADGGVFTFGSAEFKGSTGDIRLNSPVIAMLTTPTGAGYWLAAADGGIFAFGAGAEFLGSMGGTRLNSPVLDLIN